jgi:hypothetical protein
LRQLPSTYLLSCFPSSLGLALIRCLTSGSLSIATMVSFNFIVALAMGVSSTVVAQYQTVTVTATVPCTAASGAAAALPTVDLGYAVQQATVNVSSSATFPEVSISLRQLAAAFLLVILLVILLLQYEAGT